MAVESVNSANNNTGLYTAGAATIGGAGGALYGWNSKPYLKGGEFKDSFVKAVGNGVLNSSSDVPAAQKEFFKSIPKLLDNLKNCNSAEAYRKLSLDSMDNILGAFGNIDEFKSSYNSGAQVINLICGNNNNIELINSASSMDEVKRIFIEAFDKELSEKGFEAMKKEASDLVDNVKAIGLPITVEDLGKMSLDSVWDSKNKKFLKDQISEESWSVINKQLKKFKGKTALIFGAAGAAVLGAVTFFCSKGKNPQQPAEVSQEQA